MKYFRDIKLLSFAAVFGFASGGACVAARLFFELMQRALTGHFGSLPEAAQQMPLWQRALTPAIGAAGAICVARVAKYFRGSAKFQEYIEAVQRGNGSIPFLPTLWRTVSSAFSIATGAAIGREGSMIQFAAGAASALGNWWRTATPLATRVTWGVAGAVAAAYQAPIAGAFFAAEIANGKIIIGQLIPLLIAAEAGAVVSKAVLGSGPLFAAPATAPLDIRSALLVLAAGAIIGALGPLYYWVIRCLRNARHWPASLVWSGLFIGAISLIQPMVWGNGDVALRSLLQATPAAGAVLTLAVLRLCATSFCVGTGTVGGVFTPTAFTGAAIGLVLAHALHATSPLPFAIAGLAALLASTTHAPLMAAFMAAELTGQWALFPVIFLSSLIAWQIARRLSPHSLYSLATPEPAMPVPKAASTADAELALR